MRTTVAAMLAGSSLMAVISPALAQQPPSPQNQQPRAEREGADNVEEIIVTGTLIRGIAPTGNQVLGVTREDIEAIGANSSNDVLASIPQLGSMFNNLNAVGLTGNAGPGTTIQNTAIQVIRPQLRNIGTNTAGSSPTLILMDGHRIVGAGVTVASPDAGVIPQAVVERVEVVTDGGTALYGTDAVGGVINFITRRSFDGVRVTGRYGVGADYDNYDAGITAGTDWGSGSVYGSASINSMDPVFGIDRDWNRNVNWNSLAPDNRFLTGESRQCELGNVSSGGLNYAVNPGRTSLGLANGYNACDATDYTTLSPDQESISLFGGFSQQFKEGIELNVRSFFTRRETTGGSGPFRSSVSIDDETASAGSPGQSPYYVDLPGAPANGALQSVNFNYAPVNGNGLNAAYAYTQIEEGGVTPTLTVDLPADWQLNLTGNYGWSETQFRNPQVNSARQQYYASGAPVPSGANTAAFVYNNTAGPAGNNINPYNIGASNPAVLADILNWQRYGSGELTLKNFRAVFDGPLFTLPGGEVRAAVGAEYIEEKMKQRLGNSNLFDERVLPKRGISRDVTAFFAELNVPVIGEGNGIPFAKALTLSLSGRHDEYSDFGETTNPQAGLVWKVTDWFSLRSNWGKSFNAPSPLEVLNQEFPSLQVVQLAFPWSNLVPPADHRNLACFLEGEDVTAPGGCATPAGNTPTVGSLAGRFLISLNGAQQDLQPQTGESWSVGFDAHAPFLPNLRLSATYYKVLFANSLTSFQNFIFAGNQNNYNTWSNYLFLQNYDGSGAGGAFTTADIDAFCGLSVDASLCSSVRLTPGLIYQLTDTRFDNFGRSRQEGVDVSLRYTHDFSWGAFDTGLSGNYRITSETQTTPTAAQVQTNLNNISRYNVAANAGVTVGDFYARLTMNYSDAYEVTFNNGAALGPNSSGPFQDKVDAFYPVDLFVRYDLGALSIVDGLQLSLNLDNLFDEEPPLWRQNGGNGSQNGNTLGRVISVGFTADF